MCGESHWKAAQNTPRRRADETGLEIAGCRHGLAQWAVNMYQGEIYGYAHYLQSKKTVTCWCEVFLGGHRLQILEVGGESRWL